MKTSQKKTQARNTQIKQQTPIMKDPSFCSRIIKSCCFPAFWLLILVLALVFGIFFAIVARDKAGQVVDWRQVNNVTDLAATGPASGASSNTTITSNNTVKINETQINVKKPSETTNGAIVSFINNPTQSITPVLNVTVSPTKTHNSKKNYSHLRKFNQE